MTKTVQAKSVFETLNAINVNGHTEKKNGLTYLSWAWAWAEVKKNYPDASYTIYENEDGMLYHTDGRTCWVKTGVTICGQEHIEYLPVMDYRNNSIPVDKVTSTDVNKTIQRSLTKACARHGLGLYIYAGEDLPEEEKESKTQQASPQGPQQPSAPAPKKEVTLDTIKGWISKAKKESDLMAIYKQVPPTLIEQVKPLLTARKNELKGGAA